MSHSIIKAFYEAFQAQDATKMAECYHKDVVFNDPVFKNLDYHKTCGMWSMLIERSKGELAINFHSVSSDDKVGKCTWEADYLFSKTGRKVHNIIHASMQFKDDLIVRHTDTFDFWKWSRMALGTPGLLLGWSPLIKNKVQKMAHQSLNHYLSKH